MTRRLAAEDGFTIVELIVASTIMVVLLFAALGSLDAFNRSAASTSLQAGAEDSARRSASRIVAILRNAGAPAPVSGAQPATVLRALDNDLVFVSTAWPGESATGTATTHVARLCLDTASRTVWFDGLHAATSGPTDPGAACPSTATGWTHRQMATRVVNSAAQPLFQYGSTNPVRSVGLALRLDGGTSATPRPLALKSGGTLRGALAPQVTAGDVTVGPCEAGKALLTLTAGAGGTSVDGVKLAASQAIAVGPGKILVDATSSPVEVALTVTNVLGLQTLLLKQVSCP